MSATELSTPTTVPPPGPRAAVSSWRRIVGTWFRVALVCAILLGSYAVRNWQARTIEAQISRGLQGPSVKLEEIPLTLGAWKGESSALDPMIARGTGADQVVTRRYVNQDTGATVDMVLLYGPAVHMYLHSPEVCYPAAGYAQVAGPAIRGIADNGDAVPFKALVYTKGEGGLADLQEVYYTWWYNNHWTPNAGRQKDFERIPSMYKIQLARRVTSKEKRDVGNPCESLLHELLPVMERRMSELQSHARAH